MRICNHFARNEGGNFRTVIPAGADSAQLDTAATASSSRLNSMSAGESSAGSFKELFGGALRVKLPESFEDISSLRQVITRMVDILGLLRSQQLPFPGS